MQRRKLGTDLDVSALGLGCMGMSEFYGPRDDELAMRVLQQAIEMGVDFLDTADMYGPYHNEELIGRFLAACRPKVRVATKFGIARTRGIGRDVVESLVARHTREKQLGLLGQARLNVLELNLALDALDPSQVGMSRTAVTAR